MTGDPTTIGVVLIHYGRSEPTLRCLRSVLEDRSRTARRIVVVDNFGNLKRSDFEPHVSLVRREDNPGFGGGANVGVRAHLENTDLEAFLILNNDVEVESGFIDGIGKGLNSDTCGAVGGPIHSGTLPPTLWYAGGSINFVTGTVHQSRSPEDAGLARDVGFIPGTAIAVRAKAWHDIGGFDESYFLYNEDIDLCLRLRRRGWRLRFEPTMGCTHHLGETTGSAHRSALYLEQITTTRLRPFRPRAYQLYLSVIHSFYNAARIAMLIVRRGRAARTQVQALWQGHMRAVAGIFSQRPRAREAGVSGSAGRDRPS